MICSTLSGKLAVKHPILGILCREDGYVFRHNTMKKGQPYEWSKGTLGSSKNQYRCFTVYLKRKCFLVHRLIAECLIPNPEHKPTVDHLDRNPQNNVKSNLRWATMKEQVENSSIVLNRMDYGVRACDDFKAYIHNRYLFQKNKDPEAMRLKNRRSSQRFRDKRKEKEQRA